MNKNVQVYVPKKSFKQKLAAFGAGTTALVVSGVSNAALTAADLEAKYASSGADDIMNTVGLIVIGVCVTIMAIAIGIRIFRKG